MDPEGALKLEPSGAHFKELSWALLGPASAALGPALQGCSLDLIGDTFYWASDMPWFIRMTSHPNRATSLSTRYYLIVTMPETTSSSDLCNFNAAVSLSINDSRRS